MAPAKKGTSPTKAKGSTAKATAQPARRSGRAKSKLTVEDSDEEIIETPKPADGCPTLPPTPRTPKRSRKSTRSGSVESDTPLDSPSPTKKLKTLKLEDVSQKSTPFPIVFKPNMGKAPAATSQDLIAAANAALNLGDREPEKVKPKVKGASESEDESEDNAEEGGESKDDGGEEDEEDDDDGDDPFASKAAGPAASATTLNRELSDARNKRTAKLPKEDGIPEYTRDAALYKAAPEMDHPNLQLGAIVTWKKNLTGDNDKVCYMSITVYKKITKDKLALQNIVKGLSMPSEGIFYNPACADPRNFIMKIFETKYGPQWELVDLTGTPVVGVTVGSCIRSDLRGECSQDYRSFSIIPHRGHWERMGSFHCMTASVRELVGQVVDNVVSLQTRPKSHRGPQNALKDDSKSTGDVFGGMLESYTSPVKKRSMSDRRVHTPYRFDEEVPILDGTGTEIDFSSMGLRHHLTTLPAWTGDVPQRAPCVIGYTMNTYEWDNVFKCKLFIQFVIVLAVPKAV